MGIHFKNAQPEAGSIPARSHLLTKQKHMCQFKSAIVTATLDVLSNPYTDAHEDLIRLFKLNDTPTPRGEPRFARVEFRPEKVEDMADPDKYILVIDEQRTPEWFDDKAKEKVTEKLKIIISGMIIKGDADLLCGGAYILANDAKVACVKNALIHAMLGTSRVGEMRETSRVGTMWGTSQVGTMWETSQVGEMRETSRVGTMWGTSQVGEMRETSQVGKMWGTSQLGKMRETSRVGT
ncbi:MAG: hypothetical protein PHQ12_01155, partial [Chthoniobacteraceae bacterium]|nr:hypothetical protein [Chthoniobacteraceae bacterium]